MKTAHSTQDDSLVARLKRWQNDRGALANLRCALRSDLRLRAWPFLAQLTSLEGRQLVIYETVAGLWAADPEGHHAGCGNFGATCRGIRGDHESFDLRFRQLLACDDREELCTRLVSVARAAQAKDIPVDYDQLFRDLRFYAGDGRDRVRIRWGQAYWGSPAGEETPETATANTATP